MTDTAGTDPAKAELADAMESIQSTGENWRSGESDSAAQTETEKEADNG